MIAKLMKGSGFKGVINYILDPKKGTELIDSSGVRTDDISHIIQSFIDQTNLNSRVSKVVGHISLSFSTQDSLKLSNEFMTQVAREYMEKMGIKDTQYIIGRHFDKDHPHVHIAFNRIDNHGKTISDKNDRFRSEKICKELTTKYDLYFASGKEKVKEHRLKEPDKTKYEIYQALKAEIAQCRNWKDLLAHLKSKILMSVSSTKATHRKFKVLSLKRMAIVSMALRWTGVSVIPRLILPCSRLTKKTVNRHKEPSILYQMLQMLRAHLLMTSSRED